MPKYKKSTERFKAKRLVKSCIASRLNQSEVARREGVSQQAINQQFHRKPTQDCLQKFLNSKKLKRKLIKVAEDGLNAKKIIGYLHQFKKGENGEIEKAKLDEAVSNDFLTVEDIHARHKFWRDLMMANGSLKQNGVKVEVLNITIQQKEQTLANIRKAVQENLV